MTKNAFTANYDASSNSLSFECADIKKYGATNSSIVTIEYTATLNDKAVIGSAGNKNEVTLEFSNNPNSEGDGDHGTTPKDTVIVFTYKVIINKTDADNKPLKGAAFELYKNSKMVMKQRSLTKKLAMMIQHSSHSKVLMMDSTDFMSQRLLMDTTQLMT